MLPEGLGKATEPISTFQVPNPLDEFLELGVQMSQAKWLVSAV
jgi:hypothetical protein